MPPVVNTYGSRKRKRRGLPKFIRSEAPNTDYFEALNIENIKEIKALADAKKKDKKKLKEDKKTVNKPLVVPPANQICLDSDFDKLLGGSFNCLPLTNLSNCNVVNVSSSFDESCRVQKGTLIKGVSKRKTRRVKRVRENSIFAVSLCSQNSYDEVPLAQRLKTNKTADKKDFEGTDFSLPDAVKAQGDSASCRVGAKRISVINEVKHCEEKLWSPLSPIYPVNGSTSTPCEKSGVGFWCSPLNHNHAQLKNGLEPEHNDHVFSDIKICEESRDLFSSLDHHEDNVNRAVKNCSGSDMLISSHTDCRKNLQSEFEPLSNVSQENLCFPRSPDLFQSETTVPSFSDHAPGDSCVILEPGCVESNVIGKSDSLSTEILVTSNVLVKSTESESISNHCRVEHSLCNSHISNMSPDKEENCPKENLSGSLSKINSGLKKNCYISLTRCDEKSCFSQSLVMKQNITSKECSVSARSSYESTPTNFHDSSVHMGSMNELQSVENVTSYLDELKLSPANNHEQNKYSQSSQSLLEVSLVDVCTVSLEDISIGRSVNCYSKKISDTSDHVEELNVQDSCTQNSIHQQVEIPLIHNCKVSLRRCDSVESTSEERIIPEKTNNQQPLRNSFAKFSMSRLSQNHRLSTHPESVVLKPGKQWRRSLSILSRIRLSAGEQSASVRPSLSSDDMKLKGKRWESAVNSVAQLQPANDVILEDIETSINLMKSCSGRYSSSFALNGNSADSVILDISNRECTESGAALIFSRCGQDGPVSFQDCYPPSMKKSTKKIGEGVYGEVFFYSGCADRCPSVIKIIPIEGTIDVNGEPQKKFGEIFSEVCIAQELSKLRKGSENVTSSFNELLDIHCVKGCYPEWLQDLWHEYDESKGSENDSPEMFQEDQLYLVLELQNGGKDLESFIFSSADQGLAAFKQIALTLAVGEKALQFEHRDLHWGNVLISSTKQKDIHFILNGEPLSTPSKGIEVSIIDFTLSRVTDPCSGKPIYFDLSCDDTLFTAEGDYQFDIYRLMKEYCGNNWGVFTSKTNIAWLHYLLDKLCTMARYKNRSSKLHNKALNILLEMKDTVLMFESASQFVRCPFFSN